MKLPPRKGIKQAKMTIRAGTHSGPIGKAKILTAEQFDRAMQTALDTSIYGHRDRLFVMLSRFCGMRAQEIAKLHLEDITDVEGKIDGVIRVSKRGAKYGKEREIKVQSDVLLNSLREYVKAAGIESGPIFWTQRGDPMTSNAVQKQIKAVYQRCGFKGARSHSGRRYAITTLARNINKYGGSLKDVSQWAGHADISTTSTYVDRSPEADRAAVIL